MFFYLSKEANDQGNFTIHAKTCSTIEGLCKFNLLGSFESTEEALEFAITHYPELNFVKCSNCVKQPVR